MSHDINNKIIKLCLASPVFYPTYGGSQLRFMRYLPGLQRRHLEIEIFTGTPREDGSTAENAAHTWYSHPIASMLPEEKLSGCVLRRIRLPSTGKWFRNLLFYRALLALCKDKATRPDVIQLVGTLRPMALPWIVRIQSLGIPIVYAVTIASKLTSQNNSLSFRQWRFRFLFNRLDRIVTNNSPMKKMMHDMGITTPIEVIPNGVDLAKFSAASHGQIRSKIRAELGIRDDELLLVTVGAVVPRKGGDLLLEAWSKLNRQQHTRTHLVFVGPRRESDVAGLERFHNKLEKLIAESGAPERVHFIGLTNDVGSYLQAGDIFILPSQREGMPNAVLEAMAMEKPVVITPYLGLSDDIGEPGKHFLLAQPDAESLALTLNQLIQSPDLRRNLAAEGHRLIRTTMDLERSLDRYADLYNRLACKETKNRPR